MRHDFDPVDVLLLVLALVILAFTAYHAANRPDPQPYNPKTYMRAT